MTLSVAIVGCGKIAEGHVQEIRKLRGRARVVAVCDTEPLMAEQLAVRGGIPRRYDDFDRMLERERIDVVHVTTPPGTHAALAKRAIDAGCHVYVEKPLAPSYAEARSLVDHAARAGRVLSIGYAYQFDPPALRLRELVGRGEIGEVVHVESFFGYDLGGQFGAALFASPDHWVHRLPGKLFQNNLDHLVNKIVEFVDDEDPAIDAWGSIRRVERHGDERDALHDELRIVVRGERATAFGTFSSHARPAAHFVRVYGTRGTLHADFQGRYVVRATQSKLPGVIGRIVPSADQALVHAREAWHNVVRTAEGQGHFFAGLGTLIARTYDAVATGAPPPIAPRDMLRVARICEEVLRRVPQRLEPPPPEPIRVTPEVAEVTA